MVTDKKIWGFINEEMEIQKETNSHKYKCKVVKFIANVEKEKADSRGNKG